MKSLPTALKRCSKYFLEIEVLGSNKGIFLSQRKYIIDLLDETGYSQQSHTSSMPNIKLAADDGELLIDPKRCRKIVGNLYYLRVTRPDIAFSVRLLANLCLHLEGPIGMLLFTFYSMLRVQLGMGFGTKVMGIVR